MKHLLLPIFSSILLDGSLLLLLLLPLCVPGFGQCQDDWVVAQIPDTGQVTPLSALAPAAIDTDTAGNLYTLGWHFGALTLEQQMDTALSLAGVDSLLYYTLVRYSPEGAIDWSFSFQAGMSPLFSPALTVGGETLTVALTVVDEVSFAGEHIVADEYSGVLLAHLSLDGQLLDWQTFFGEGEINAFGLTQDGDNNCFLSGRYTGVWELAPGITLEAGAPHSLSPKRGFVVKLDSEGEVLWATAAEDGPESRCRALAVNPGGDVYVGGYYQDSVRWGESFGLESQAGGRMPFVVRIDGTTGGPSWMRGGRSLDDSYGNGSVLGLCVGPAGELYGTGYFSTPIRFGNWQMVPVGRSDVFAFRLTPTGDLLTLKRWGSDEPEGFEWGSQLQLTPYSTLLLTANMYGGAQVGSETLPLGLDRQVVRVETDLFLTPIQTRTFGGEGQEYSYASALDESGTWSLYGATDSNEGTYGSQTLVVDAQGNLSGFVYRDCLNLLEVEEASEKQISPRIYPNPATDLLTVSMAGLHRVLVYDAWGRQMRDRRVVDREVVQLSVTAWASGVYFLRIQHQSGKWTSGAVQVFH